MTEKKIGSIYIHSLEDNFGSYESYRNFCHEQIVYLNLIYGRNGTHILSDPINYKLTKDSSKKIQDYINTIKNKMVKISEEETEESKKYISIIYIDDTTETFAFDKKVNEIFSDEFKIETDEEFEIVTEPYLNFNNSNYNKSVELLLEISTLIKEKKIDLIFNYLAPTFEVEFKLSNYKNKVNDKLELKKLYKNISGIMGMKLKSHNIFLTKLGICENNIAKVKLAVEIKGKNYNQNWILDFDFNDNNEIIKILITDFKNIHKEGKILTDNCIRDIINNKYNDFIEN